MKFIGATFGYGYAIILTLPINVLMMSKLFICYVLSIKKLNEYRRARQNLSSSDRNIVHIAKIYLCITLCCFGPTIIWQVASQLMPLNIRHLIDVYAVLLIFYVIQMQSMISPFVFVTVNQPARRMVKTFIDKYISAPSSDEVVNPPAQPPARRNRRVHPLMDPNPLQ